MERDYTRRRGQKESWVAPEHARDARSMRRDYARDENGDKVPGSSRDLVVDKRPQIMIPPRFTYIGYK